MAFVTSIVVFIVVALAIFIGLSLLDLRSARARLIRERLADVERPVEIAPNADLALLRDETLSKFALLDHLLRRSKRVIKLHQFLAQADVDSRTANFLGLSVVTGLTLGFVFWASNWDWHFGWVLGVLGLLLGFSLPFAYISRRRRKRFHKFEELFPEAIDTLARAVRAGHAFTVALELITNEVSEPIAGEFRKLYEEQKYGLPLRDALFNLVQRLPLVDVKFFATAVMLQRETGGNFAEILDNLSYVIRERFKVMRQVRIYTAQGRLTMMLLIGLPPVIVVTMLVLNPSFIRPLFDDPIGQRLIMLGAALQTFGFFVIRKVIRIQV